MDIDQIFDFVSLIIRHNLTPRHVPIDFKFYRLLVNIKDIKFTKFGVTWVSFLLFLKQNVEKSIFFRKKYAFYVLAHFSTPDNDTIMIYTSFDCVSSP